MYEQFFGLRKAPFHITPDPEFLFLSPSHKEALAAILYGVEQGKGFIVVSGEVGVGKTTILHAYLDRVDRERVRVIYVLNPNVRFAALVETVCRELGVPVGEGDVAAQVDALHGAMVAAYSQSRSVVIIIDEAQNMPVETLENLRMLSNLETSTEKLLQIVLVGQPELDRLLERPELRQLRQRIALRAQIQPFTRRESRAYIAHRLAMAGGAGARLFTRPALRAIVRRAKGIPRLLNILCDNALITGFGYDQNPVTLRTVGEVAGDLAGKPRRTGLTRWLRAGVAVIVIALGGLVLIAGGTQLANNKASRQTELPMSREPGVPEQRKAARAESGDPRVNTSAAIPEPRATGEERGAAPRDAEAKGRGGEEAKGRGGEEAKGSRGEVARGAAETPAVEPAVTKREAVVTTRVVRSGDSLVRMAAETYGSSSERVIARIQEANPGIKDPNKIQIGSRIRFPEISR